MKYINKFPTVAAYDAAEKYYPNVSYIEATDEVRYVETPAHDYSKDYLTFEALESGTFIVNVPAAVNPTYMTSISYSIDNGTTWVDLAITSGTQSLGTAVNAGDKVLLKGIGKQMSVYPNHVRINGSNKFNISGNIMSLLYGDNFEGQTSFPSGSEFNFQSLFAESTTLLSAENLVLPATTLTTGCYNGMFEKCHYLTTAPALLATTLSQGCYALMLNNCWGLNSITMLATDISANNCLYNWVTNVAATGTFTKAATQTSLPSGNHGIPIGWTVVDA